MLTPQFFFYTYRYIYIIIPKHFHTMHFLLQRHIGNRNTGKRLLRKSVKFWCQSISSRISLSLFLSLSLSLSLWDREFEIFPFFDFACRGATWNLKLWMWVPPLSICFRCLCKMIKQNYDVSKVQEILNTFFQYFLKLDQKITKEY
jgi:hypothetical protein